MCVKYSWIRHAANWDCIHNIVIKTVFRCMLFSLQFSFPTLIGYCANFHFNQFPLHLNSIFCFAVPIMVHLYIIQDVPSHSNYTLYIIYEHTFCFFPFLMKSIFHLVANALRIVHVELFITQSVDESIGKIKVFRFKVHRQWPIARFMVFYFANNSLLEHLNLNFVYKIFIYSRAWLAFVIFCILEFNEPICVRVCVCIQMQIISLSFSMSPSPPQSLSLYHTRCMHVCLSIVHNEYIHI